MYYLITFYSNSNIYRYIEYGLDNYVKETEDSCAVTGYIALRRNITNKLQYRVGLYTRDPEANIRTFREPFWRFLTVFPRIIKTSIRQTLPAAFSSQE